MYILEQAVTKTYWEPIRNSIKRKIKRAELIKIGNTGVIKIQNSKTAISYVICDADGEPIGWIYLRRRKDWAAYEVYQVYVLKEHRGLGYAERLYKAAVNTDGILLSSGKSHTKFSMGLWKKFIRNNTFFVWAHDLKNLEQHSSVELDEDEIICDLPIYCNPWECKQDVRFIAQRK